jgi:hypothetical protein
LEHVGDPDASYNGYNIEPYYPGGDSDDVGELALQGLGPGS